MLYVSSAGEERLSTVLFGGREPSWRYFEASVVVVVVEIEIEIELLSINPASGNLGHVCVGVCWCVCVF